jgi:hypothetical protein
MVSILISLLGGAVMVGYAAELQSQYEDYYDHKINSFERVGRLLFFGITMPITVALLLGMKIAKSLI